MKHITKFLALVIAAGLPCVALAQAAGAAAPVLNTESAFATFALIGITLGALRDYSRPFRPLSVSEARPKSTAPTVVLHRPAYGIRRGSEAARLAA